MFQVSVFFATPADPAVFDEHYTTRHREILSRLPGLRHATINRPDPSDDGTSGPHHLVTVMYWDDREAALAALEGPVGKEAFPTPSPDGWPESFTVYAESDVRLPFTPFPAGSEISGILGLYVHPADEVAFREHFVGTHIALAAALPYQTGFAVNWTVPGPDGSIPPFVLIGNQEWKNREDFDRCLASPEAEAAVGDLAYFGPGGMTLLSCRTLVV